MIFPENHRGLSGHLHPVKPPLHPRGLQGAFTLTQAATPVRVPADGVMDGMHHWGNRVRPHIDKARGKFTGSYWLLGEGSEG